MLIIDTTNPPETRTTNYKGSPRTMGNYQPFEKNSSWQELYDYMVSCQWYAAFSDDIYAEVFQALIDRYDGGERTDELKQSMCTTW